MLRRLSCLVVIALTLGLAGCDEEPWRTTDISGLLPELRFELTNEHGEVVRASDYSGGVTLLFFGYTHCPDVCPTTLAKLSTAIGRLPELAATDVQVLFVSVDPKRDTPKHLAAYTSAFGERFVGLTGTTDQLDALTKRYRTTYGYGEPDRYGNYLVSHASGIYVFDAEGKVQLLMRESDSLDAMVADLERLAT